METPPPLADDHGTDLNLDRKIISSPVTSFVTPFLVDRDIHQNVGNVSKSSIATLEPYEGSGKKKGPKNIDSSILHAKPIPLDWSFDIIYKEFSEYGPIKEIRSRLGDKYKYFEIWIIFSNSSDALRACNEFTTRTLAIECSQVDSTPPFLDIYKPEVQTGEAIPSAKESRCPHPARWLIVSTYGDRGNLFKLKKFINQKLGHINRPDITRFGRTSFLIHTKSIGQAVMLLNLKVDQGGLIKEVKPHFTFSYARGVIFNEDIYDLSEEEILDMCPEYVWKIFKVPRSSMVILTFVNADLPQQIVFESEIV